MDALNGQGEDSGAGAKRVFRSVRLLATRHVPDMFHLVFFYGWDYVLPRNKEATCWSSRGKECWI